MEKSCKQTPWWMVAMLLFIMVSCTSNKSGNAPGNPIEHQQRKRVSPPPAISMDSVFAAQVWSFRYSDGMFPCDSYGFYGCMIRGLDTDGDGLFYIAGGNPIRLVCYKGTKMEYQREISNGRGENALFHLVKDSLYFLEENELRMIRLNKDGRGEIEYFDLGLNKEDSIFNGRCDDQGFWVLTTDIPSTDTVSSYQERQNHIKGYRYLYPNRLIQTIARGQNVQKLYSVRNEYLEERLFNFVGYVDEWEVYVKNRYGNIDHIAFAKQDIKEIHYFELKGLPPIASACGADSRSGWFSSPNLDALRKGKLYLSGYDNETETFQIQEFDLLSISNSLKK